MDVQINIKMPKVSEKVQKKIDSNKRRAFLAAAQEGVNTIVKRTTKGVSYHGGAFKPYSESYKETRIEKKRGTKPDLQLTGNMIASIQAKSTNRKGTIFFNSATESAKAQKNQQTRPFFGFDTKEEDSLRNTYRKWLLRGVE
tara:strand:- start:3550 stop:3975 length:426 start_codon:yes stop_codon:yes gene_type:complete